jgi:hypothetical protein
VEFDTRVDLISTVVMAKPAEGNRRRYVTQGNDADQYWKDLALCALGNSSEIRGQETFTDLNTTAEERPSASVFLPLRTCPEFFWSWTIEYREQKTGSSPEKTNMIPPSVVHFYFANHSECMT